MNMKASERVRLSLHLSNEKGVEIGRRLAGLAADAAGGGGPITTATASRPGARALARLAASG